MINQKYSIKAKPNFTYSGRNYNWQWGDFNTTTNTDLLITGPTVKNAYYKGTQISNNVTAYSSNSQRKFIKVPYSAYHVSVYESMGKVWLEGTLDNGVTWELLNNGKAINENTTAKNPSLAVVSDGKIAIAYQEIDTVYKIKIKIFNLIYPNNNAEYEGLVTTLPGNYDTNPVVSVKDVVSNSTLTLMIVWDQHYPNSTGNPWIALSNIKKEFIG